MFKNIFIGLFLLLILNSCATKPVKVNSANLVPSTQVFRLQKLAIQNKAKAIFVRDKGFLGSAVYQHLYIDGKEAAQLMPSEKVIFELKEGEHIFDVIATDPFGTVAKSSIVSELKTGKTYYYRILMDGRTFKSYIQRFIPTH